MPGPWENFKPLASPSGPMTLKGGNLKGLNLVDTDYERDKKIQDTNIDVGAYGTKKKIDLETPDKIPSDKVLLLSEGAQMPKILDDLEATFKNTSVNGPISGAIRSMVPWDTEARTIQGKIGIAKQLVGKFLEGGVLRKEDEVKYEKILPQITDTPDVALNKIGNLRGLLSQRYNSMLESLKQAGYKEENFPRIQSAAPFKQSSNGSLTPEEEKELQTLEMKYGGKQP